jgi:hypothetical protein
MTETGYSDTEMRSLTVEKEIERKQHKPNDCFRLLIRFALQSTQFAGFLFCCAYRLHCDRVAVDSAGHFGHLPRQHIQFAQSAVV